MDSDYEQGNPMSVIESVERACENPKFCECGCGQEVTVNKYRPRRFVNGHQNRSRISKRKGKQFWKGKEYPRPMLGKHHSEETKKRISEAKKGQIGWWKGKKLSLSHRKKLSEKQWSKGLTKETDVRLEKMGETMRRVWQNPEYRERTLRAQREGMSIRPTAPEMRFIKIVEKNDIPYKYVGSGDFWIENINPDFIEVNGKKIAIEIFGDYWHSPFLNPNLRETMTLDYRKKTFKRYGWKLIVLWESDLLREDSEQFVLSKLGELTL